MNLPNLIYVYFAYVQPQSLWIIASGVAFEQFGYGFGFTAFTLYLIFMSQGEFKTAHYAIGTGIMHRWHSAESKRFIHPRGIGLHR